MNTNLQDAADMRCPPCTGRCNQGRQCAANTPAEACTEIGSDAPSFTAAAWFWSLYLSIALVAALAGIAALI